MRIQRAAIHSGPIAWAVVIAFVLVGFYERAHAQDAATADRLAELAEDGPDATDAAKPAAVTPFLEQLVATGGHADGPVRRWQTLATDSSALQRLVAIDELARAARFDSRAATIVRLLAAHDDDPRVRRKAALIAPRLPLRLTVHVRRLPAGGTGTPLDTPTVRVGWQNYEGSQFDALVAALTSEPIDVTAAASTALSHGMAPSGDVKIALLLAGGSETWSTVEPIVQALSSIGTERVAAVSTTTRGQLTPDHTNLTIAGRFDRLSSNGEETGPLKIVLGREGDETTIRIVGLSDPQPSFAALTANLRALCRTPENPTGPYTVDDLVAVDAGESVQWLDVVEALNAARTAGFRRVVMASIVPPVQDDEIDATPAPAPPEKADTDDTPKPAYVPEDAVVMFGTNLGQADSVVYVIDASGSVIATMPHLLRAVQASIKQLNDSQKFDVLFFRDGDVDQVPPLGMRLATKAERDRAVEWLTPGDNRAQPAGRTDPVPALRIAFGYRPQLIVLVSDSIRGDALTGNDHASLMKVIEDLDPHDRVRVSTVQWLYPDQVGTLEAIAKKTDGVYRFVSAADAGLKGRLPKVDGSIETKTSKR